MDFLKGYKTYIVSALFIVATLLQSCRVITPEQYQVILGLLSGAGLAALRAGVSNAVNESK